MNAPPGSNRHAALVLAGGASRRAGAANKLLACDRSGQAMIAASVGVALRSMAGLVIVVLGHDRDGIATRLDAAGLAEAGRLQLVHAHDHAEGLAASLRCGIAQAMRAGADAALVCLGDMPLVRPSTLDRLMHRADADPEALACVPALRGEAGNPVLWRRTLFEALLSLSGDRGARGLLERHAACVRMVAVDDPGILEDFDTPERLAAYFLHEPGN